MLCKDVASHIDEVHRLVRGGGGDPRLIRSWQRSLEAYRLDPARIHHPRILTGGSLREHQESIEAFTRIAHHGLTQLHAQVRDAGYVVLLTDAAGVTVDFIGNPRLERELKDAGLYLGACWSEREEGTCGVGTCIEDGQPITVHRGEHFRAPNISLSCSAAPVHDEQGRVLAVLDASALYSPPDKGSQWLVYQLVTRAARMIGDAHFLHTHAGHWLLRLARAREFLDVQAEYLIAFDGDGRVLGTNHAARHDLFSGRDPAGLSCERLFDARLEDLARHAHASECPLPVFRRGVPEHLFGRLLAPRAHTVHVPPPARRPPPSPLVCWAGDDAGAQQSAERALRLLARRVPVLLQGETGVGKERFAQAMHRAGPRAAKPFVALNCAAIPESLIESELFGYREGAFTGARAKGMRGRIVQADGGTLFLDEIGDMPLDLQSRLLRVLAEWEVLPLGAETPIRVDLQLICASHRDLRELVAAGHFREDLYYRLAGAVLKLPPLRERSDLDRLIGAILAEVAGDETPPPLRPDALAALRAHRWPGNLRELHNALRYALAVCDGHAITRADLPEEIAAANPAPPPRADSERERIETVLHRNGWCMVSGARELGIARATLYRRMAKLGIVPPNRRAAG
ncbi:GAF modulated Fis family sigma54 specific transcriptional regulator [Plasticicumulans lactativorans]|uniref:GAF modulated Fis family sigma54 specific transcriptional regulator n=1 Tax=Plasticicumulans lactativorans TaxID=1133106 RepID=A0A4R2KSZ6_9GAMM|nr:sigma-54-dependent Fis family transcriptional regulator [Plasticicumulans lactativorans]TCO77501.1 GAF modulated Fis family sigma54 specific transcriptional regulator [Plasticicumulans lactativorans]